MTWADFGYPVMLGILIFWGLFAIFAILSTFTKRENLKDLKQFIHRFLDTSGRNHSHEGL